MPESKHKLCRDRLFLGAVLGGRGGLEEAQNFFPKVLPGVPSMWYVCFVFWKWDFGNGCACAALLRLPSGACACLCWVVWLARFYVKTGKVAVKVIVIPASKASWENLFNEVCLWHCLLLCRSFALEVLGEAAKFCRNLSFSNWVTATSERLLPEEPSAHSIRVCWAIKMRHF